MIETPSAKEISDLQEKYHLSYHVNYAFHAQQLVGLKGKRVLEVGGSLPRDFVLNDLGASEWVALEYREYWDEVLSTGNVTGTPPVSLGTDAASPIMTNNAAERYRILFGSINTMPESLASSFDVVFSIAAFEHIARLPEALEQMYRALTPGGKLFSLFAPIWSSYAGHHLPDITDQNGIVWGGNNCPIPEWGHLLLKPMELFDHLKLKCDANTAREIVYFVYGSPHINRFFLEDYIDIVSRSPFSIKLMSPQWAAPIPDGIKSALSKAHPARSDFSNLGLLLVLERE